MVLLDAVVPAHEADFRAVVDDGAGVDDPALAAIERDTGPLGPPL
jgi:hypothetical protein